MDRRKELKEQYKRMRPEMGVIAFIIRETGKTYLVATKDTKSMKNRLSLQLATGSLRSKSLQAEWNALGAAAFDIQTLEVLSYKEDDKEGTGDYSEDLETLQDICLERIEGSESI